MNGLVAGLGMLGAAALSDRSLTVNIRSVRMMTRSKGHIISVQGAGNELRFEGNLIDSMIYAVGEVSAIARHGEYDKVVAYTNEPAVLNHAVRIWLGESMPYEHLPWSVKSMV